MFPSKDGIRIEPSIDKSLKEKYDKIKAAATREKKPKEPKEPKPPKEPKQPKKEGDDIKKFLSVSRHPNEMAEFTASPTSMKVFRVRRKARRRGRRNGIRMPALASLVMSKT